MQNKTDHSWISQKISAISKLNSNALTVGPSLNTLVSFVQQKCPIQDCTASDFATEHLLVGCYLITKNAIQNNYSSTCFTALH